MVSDYQCVTSTHVAPSRKASDESTSIRNSGDAYAERATIPTPGSARPLVAAADGGRVLQIAFVLMLASSRIETIFLGID